MRSAVAIALAAAVCVSLAAETAGATSADHPFPRPPGIHARIKLWTRVYAEIDTNGGLIHDNRNLDVVYEVIRWPKGLSPAEEERRIARAKDHYADVLERLASGKTRLTPEERRVLALFPPGTSRASLGAAADRIRFQRGLANRFRDGLIRSGQWEDHIRKVFRERGLPQDLAALPHVESSYNPQAYSKVGAAGLWQFMPSTGAQYMRIDRAVDERYDPWRSSEAAAALLRDNYRTTGTWPLAITSYNHGAGGMLRAVKQLGTRDIATIIERYESPTWGFASKNFYTSFLAASDVERNAARYFGEIRRERPVQHELFVTRHPTSAQALARTFGVDVGLLREMNLGLRDGVWNGRIAVPSGYAMRLPRVAGRPSAEQLAAALPRMEAERPARAKASASKHRVRRGETLSLVARRYGVPLASLARANGLRTTSKLKIGQTLKIPGTLIAPSERPSRAAAAKASKATKASKAKASKAKAARSHTVRRGETLTQIARRSGVSVKQLAAANGISPSTRVRTGQRLRIPD
ncbi:MAG: lytic transglycosylase [Proteobacteria bacterium]|nr:MAG: lytic transglycosylase [Pseudomonadota bacterium]